MKLLVGIPAFNEERVIAKVIASVPKRIGRIGRVDIVVVDDGSSDKTYEVAVQNHVHVVKHLLNRGLGGALKTTFSYARRYGYDALVTIDADGQHRGEDIAAVLDPVRAKTADVVVGSRWLGRSRAPRGRLMINALANVLTYILFGVPTTDSQSGMRAFSKRAIQTIHLRTDGMEVSSEVFREIYRNRLRFAEVPIKPIYTAYSQRKGQKISNFPNVMFELLLRFLR